MSLYYVVATIEDILIKWFLRMQNYIIGHSSNSMQWIKLEYKIEVIRKQILHSVLNHFSRSTFIQLLHARSDLIFANSNRPAFSDFEKYQLFRAWIKAGLKLGGTLNLRVTNLKLVVCRRYSWDYREETFCDFHWDFTHFETCFVDQKWYTTEHEEQIAIKMLTRILTEFWK